MYTFSSPHLPIDLCWSTGLYSFPLALFVLTTHTYILLIVQGILLVILTLTYTVYPEINYIMLLITASLLLMYSNYYRVYKNKLVQFNDNFFLILLIVIGTTDIHEQQARRIIIYASIGIGLVIFCGITVGSKLFQVCCKKGKQREFVLNEQRRRQRQNSDSALSQEAILDEIEPLLGDTEVILTYWKRCNAITILLIMKSYTPLQYIRYFLW